MPLNRKKPLAVFIAKCKDTKINNLPTDAQVLFGFLTLIVDIRYRARYKSAIENRRDSE